MELKKCPFCGGEVRILPIDLWGKIQDEDYQGDDFENVRYVIVHTILDNDVCPIATGAREALGYYNYESKEEAAEAWNERI